jgi:hypothetical protein
MPQATALFTAHARCAWPPRGPFERRPPARHHSEAAQGLAVQKSSAARAGRSLQTCRGRCRCAQGPGKGQPPLPRGREKAGAALPAGLFLLRAKEVTPGAAERNYCCSMPEGYCKHHARSGDAVLEARGGAGCGRRAGHVSASFCAPMQQAAHARGQKHNQRQRKDILRASMWRLCHGRPSCVRWGGDSVRDGGTEI